MGDSWTFQLQMGMNNKQIHWAKLRRDLVYTLNSALEPRVQVLLTGGEKNTMCFLRGHWEPHAQRCGWKGTWVVKARDTSIVIDVSGSQWHRHCGVKTRLWLEVVPCTAPVIPKLQGWNRRTMKSRLAWAIQRNTISKKWYPQTQRKQNKKTSKIKHYTGRKWLGQVGLCWLGLLSDI